MIPARRALIGYSYAANGRTFDRVLVIEQDSTKPASYLGPPEWQRAMFTAGACDRDWLRPGYAHQTPAGVFGDMLATGGFAVEVERLGVDGDGDTIFAAIAQPTADDEKAPIRRSKLSAAQRVAMELLEGSHRP